MEKTKVLISQCYGGYGLTQEVLNKYKEATGKETKKYDIPRHDKDLIRIVEEIGLDKAGDTFAKLTIIEIPGAQYNVVEYDGYESIDYPEGKDWILVDTPEKRDKYPELFL